jgi:sodium-dependent phosphate transporter
MDRTLTSCFISAPSSKGNCSNPPSFFLTVGGIIGFALVWGGSDAVVWAQKDPTGSSFPPYKGVVSIVLAWFIAPALTGAIAAILFFALRFLVLRRRNAYTLAFWVFPPLVLITTWINMYFVFTKVSMGRGFRLEF